MDLIIFRHTKKTIKLVLVFFLFLILYHCKSENTSSEIKVIYKDEKATSIELGPGIDDFQVYLKGNETTPVLGKIVKKENGAVFIPALPFTKGRTYTVKKNQLPIGDFRIKLPKNSSTEILNIYPTTETVPQNLLKMYINFSEPMQEIGSSRDFITIYEGDSLEEKSIFLELENELWNKEHDLLTLWLDPGRIKKDLIPNKEMGMPLVNGKSYRMVISKDWKARSGNQLQKDYLKLFTVGNLDKTRPDIESWKLKIPQSRTRKELTITFNEILDSQLALETMAIYDREENFVTGKFNLMEEERGISFTPIDLWQIGEYTIEIESRLEDLAGNNLNRLFDTDLNKESPQSNMNTIKKLEFNIN